MERLIDIHTHRLNSPNQVELLNADFDASGFNHKFNSIGLHPWNIKRSQHKNDLEKLTQNLSAKNIIALGEIGLDRSIMVPFDFQKKVFEQQVKLSEEMNLPAIIHCVRAWSEVLDTRLKLKTKQPWIFHGFNANIQIANQITKHGCYFSFGKGLLGNQKVMDLFNYVPIESIFLETDDSDEQIETIYCKAIEIRNIPESEFIDQIQQNFESVFPDADLS